MTRSSDETVFRDHYYRNHLIRFQSITPIPSLPRMNNNCIPCSTVLPLTPIWEDWIGCQKERFTRQVTYNDFHMMWLISIEQVRPCLMLLNSTILSWYTISGTHWCQPLSRMTMHYNRTTRNAHGVNGPYCNRYIHYYHLSSHLEQELGLLVTPVTQFSLQWRV